MLKRSPGALPGVSRLYLYPLSYVVTGTCLAGTRSGTGLLIALSLGMAALSVGLVRRSPKRALMAAHAAFCAFFFCWAGHYFAYQSIMGTLQPLL